MVLDGWFALRSGALAEATALLGTRGEDPRARFGLAKAAQLAGRPEEMIDHAAYVARVVPESVVGVMSVRMLEHFGRAVRPAPHALAVAAAAGDIPEHLEELHLHPERVLDVRLLPPDVIGQPFAPFDLAFEINNIGSLPVPLGEGGLSEFLALEIESDLARRGMIRHGRPASVRLEGRWCLLQVSVINKPLVCAPSRRGRHRSGWGPRRFGRIPGDHPARWLAHRSRNVPHGEARSHRLVVIFRHVPHSRNDARTKCHPATSNDR